MNCVLIKLIKEIGKHTSSLQYQRLLIFISDEGIVSDDEDSELYN